MEKVIKDILDRENIRFKSVEKSNSGFTNYVYFVDDKYVVKVIKDIKKIDKILKEIKFYKNANMDFIPKFIASGELNGMRYLIISKLPGKSLFKVWHQLEQETKENVIDEICGILTKFHKLNYLFLDEKYVVLDWIKKWQKSFNINIEILKKKGFNVSLLEKFKEENLQTIFAEQKNALIYNDAHFDNFVYNQGKLQLIDFDRIMYCSVDYELLIIKQMLDNPKKFAGEEDEENVDIRDYLFIWDRMKTKMPEVFDFKYLEERLFIYHFIYNLGQAYEFKKDDWIERELNKFDEFYQTLIKSS